jgi:putative flippase GtrA
MSKFVNLLRTPHARYAIGAGVSWPIYGSLYIAMLEILDRHYAAAAGISWILSYGVVYAFQKYGTFGAMSRQAVLREAGRYAVVVVGLSAAVNFGKKEVPASACLQILFLTSKSPCKSSNNEVVMCLRVGADGAN